MAQPFDPNGLRLSGEPTRLLEALDAPVFAVSGDTLAALDYLPRVLQLSWLERASGKLSPIGVKPFPLEGGRLSHDGTRLATIVVDRVTGNKDIWVIDLSRGVSTRLSSSTGEQPLDPIWSADDSKIAYASQHDTWTDIRTRNASGTGEEEVLFSHGTSYILPVDWSSDGKSIAVAEYGKDGQHWRMSVLAVAKRAEKELWSGLGEAFPGTISPGALSPDGRFFAYCNEESGRSEVYVESIGHGGGRRQVSISGGSFPIFWSRDGKEILFVSPDGSQAMAAGVRTDPGLGTTPPRPVADVASISALAGVSSDGKKWLVASESGNKRPDTITLVQNWVAGLRR
jgi:Tol biopolymer transport system component